MVKIMNTRNSKGRNAFGVGCKACADESNLSPNNDMVRAPAAPSLCSPIMSEPYQKGDTPVGISGAKVIGIAQPTNGFRMARPGNRPKSLSAVHSSFTPCCWHKATTRASCTCGPDMRPVRSVDRRSGQ